MSKAVVIPECGHLGGVKEPKEEISLSPTEKKDTGIGLLSRLLRFESLGKRSAPESPTCSEPLTTYYGVYIPCEIKKGPDEGAIHVYEKKSEALELVRRYKTSRFKAFKNRQDAVSFALRGAEPTDTTDGNDNSLMGEKPYPFKAPSPQDMVSLRKAIEEGLACTVLERVWDNPRFLVSSGNTPAIMQEGSRYNALHIAAKAMNAELCNLILTTVGNPGFVQRLYGVDADADSCKEFAHILVDRYLNTPDKAMNETPLHFAAKFGAPEVVDVLTSFPQCNKSAVNKFGEQAKDIICKRAPNATKESACRIACMLHERYYVPVLHCEDGTAAPTIGRPFTPAHPPEINQDPMSPRYEIRAFAGPMEAPDAELFRRRWKTPPRSARTTFRLKDITKGLEIVGRNLAEQMKVDWKEYWPFLDTFTDLRTPEGLALLENYLKNKYESACSIAFNDSISQSQPDPFSISRISMNNSFTEMSPISELCEAMNTCKLNSETPPRRTDRIRQMICRQPLAKVNGEVTPINHTVSELLLIEKTCQVFAKRIADALYFSLTAEPEIASESLRSEAKHLHHTMYTYMTDERFKKIDFALTHSRLAQLVVHKLKEHTNEIDDINSLAEFLIKLRCPNDDIFSSDDERKTSFRGPNKVKISHVINNHVRCLASFISEDLTESKVSTGPAVSDVKCVEIWEKASKCRCEWNIEVFERNSKKNASFRKNRSLLSTSPKSEGFIRRLTFDHDIGDGKLQKESSPAVSVNSPAGDNGHTVFTVDTHKCQVIPAEISDDESVASCQSESDVYETASELSHSDSHSDNDNDNDMHEASDRALAEPFIYGEEPTKMDRLVYEALSSLDISETQYPNVYRWRHTVALYSPADRDKWVAVGGDEGVCVVAVSMSSTPKCEWRRTRTSTPHSATPRDHSAAGDERTNSLPLQVSNWLRVTGPNSPRSSIASKSINQNVSFGF